MIRMNDFAAEPADVRRAELAAVDGVLASGQIILGPQVARFEQAWARYAGAEHCIGTGNGLEAIEIALRGLRIESGAEVITTPMTAIATVLAVLHAAATPVFADIDPTTALLDIASAERCLTRRTRAVLLVHLYGRAADLDQWKSFCDAHRLELIEDCAQAHGARWNGRHVGTAGRCGAFSFYPTKNLGARGDAGALITSDSDFAEATRRLRNCGSGDRRDAAPPLNSRLDEVQAAILNVRLPQLDAANARRAQIAARYRSGIRNMRIELLAPAAPESDVHHLFTIRNAERDRLVAHLRAAGIETLIRYAVAAHEQTYCAALPRDPHHLAHATRHARECLSIPCHPQLSDADVAAVIDALNRFN